MDAGNSRVRGHSAEVRMELRVNGRVLKISQLGPDFLILREPVEYPPSHAEISMSIDGTESHWFVQLPAGISPALERTRIAEAARANGSTAG
jgi:hypothetical protein